MCPAQYEWLRPKPSPTAGSLSHSRLRNATRRDWRFSLDGYVVNWDGFHMPNPLKSSQQFTWIDISSSRGPESFQQCGRVGRTSGDRFPPLWATSDGLLFGSPLRFGEGAFHHLSSLTGWPRRFQPQFVEDNYMGGVSKFLSGWAPNISSLFAYFLSMLSTWGDQTFALVLCSLTGLPQLMDVPNALRCSGLLLIGVRNWSMVWTTGLETSSLLPWLSSWTCSSSWPPPTQIMKSRMRLTRSLTNADWLVPTCNQKA